jgi:RNA polymerase sigma-70 factor (ECF subfamily)
MRTDDTAGWDIAHLADRTGSIEGTAMSFLATTGERRGRRHWSNRADTRGHSTPATSDSGPSIPPERDADAILPDLYARYWADLVRYVNGMVSDRHEAEEIAQETMLRAWQHADNLRPERGSVWSWLCRVAHNMTVDRIRRRRRRPVEFDETHTPDERAVADHCPDVLNSVYVLRALARLQPAHRTVLYLVYYQDRTCAEAAAVLGVPVGTLKSRLHYALRYLRAVLAENPPDHG